MKRLFLLLNILFMLYTPAIGHAGPKEDYEAAYMLYVAAGASVAAYNDRIGEVATSYLRQDGWKIDHYVQEEGHAGARFLIARKEVTGGKEIYVVAIVGTETAEDIKLNLKTEKVYFAGGNPEEFAANAAKKEVPEAEPKVHRGFEEYLQAGPAAKLRNVAGVSFSLADLFRSKSDYKLILTGHSLGGAAATLAGARLISMGVNPAQIEVITFGAPAVGNAAFAARFEPILNLKRVVIFGDPVTGVLQTLAGGYKQFGREIIWTIPTTIDNPHKLIGYVDVALKNYYDKRHQAIVAGVELPTPKLKKQDNRGQIYIAPLQNTLPDALAKDFWYMSEALSNEYRHIFPDYTIGKENLPEGWRKQANFSNYRWVIVPEVSALRLKQEKCLYYITVNQTVYDVATGAIVDMESFSTGTYELTPLEAFIHALKGVNENHEAWLVK